MNIISINGVKVGIYVDDAVLLFVPGVNVWKTLNEMLENDWLQLLQFTR